ncbi:acetyl-CoA decarbonylase/synthase complex subunit gamma [candidate division KSB1 bacterium]|nr:acetyl-CoA decarbonylase/synthase complex subunit gamma [candidate division KSB1 bacterium]
MALSGLAIFKLLPKTNCGDCGVPTCMAFAMKLAQQKAELSECPHAADEAKAALGAASEPPIRLVKIGVGANALEIGNETVMFRHEKTFVHQTGITIQLRSSEDARQLNQKIAEIESYIVERVGEELSADLFFITHDSSKTTDFTQLVQQVKSNSTKGVILDCPDEAALKAALELVKDDRPAIFLREAVSETQIEMAKSVNASLILSGISFDNLVHQAEKAKAGGVNDLILNMPGEDIGTLVQNNTILRRSALKKNIKPVGYPLCSVLKADDKFDLVAKASTALCKYDAIVVLPDYDRALLYTLFTLRQNIYTDPQKPIQVEPKLYAIGEPTPTSPVFVTTNFSLTYFIVSGEIENSGISAYLMVCDVEGQSVLTAWAAGKFVGETIAKFAKQINLEQQVQTRKIIIPGLVSQISGDLEENLPGWEVIVGCQEASDIPSFVKNVVLA